MKALSFYFFLSSSSSLSNLYCSSTLDTQDASQLSLDAPELDGLVLEPGESRTITFVVEALDDGSGTLDAAGTIVVELPFEQDTVEPAPEASVTE